MNGSVAPLSRGRGCRTRTFCLRSTQSSSPVYAERSRVSDGAPTGHRREALVDWSRATARLPKLDSIATRPTGQVPEGIFIGPAAAVKSRWKGRFTTGISRPLRHHASTRALTPKRNSPEFESSYNLADYIGYAGFLPPDLALTTGTTGTFATMGTQRFTRSGGTSRES